MSNDSHPLQRLHELEDRIEEIKAELDPPPSSRLKRTLRKAPGFCLAHWALLAFLATAVWAYWYYDVSFFESQRNTFESKQTAEIYRRLGDRLMLYGERDAAKDAYRNALKINPNHMAAARNLAKAQVFDSPSGQTNIIPVVVNQQIEYLNSFVTDSKERYIISYFKGEMYEDQEKYDLAKAAYEDSIKANPDFVYGYVAAAYNSILAGDGVDYAMKKLKEALAHDPDYAIALNNLGFCYIVNGDYSGARKVLERAREISPYLEVWINLGEAERYQGDADSLTEALENHNKALELLNESTDEDDDAIAGDLAFNYMPKTLGDKITPTSWVTFTNIAEKRMLVYYELSFDYATQHDWKRANQFFKRAFEVDEHDTYDEFIDNKIQAIETLSENTPDKKVVQWFESQRRRLHSKIDKPVKNWAGKSA